ncbi:MAG: M48 family metallopeptidase, partial [bacterium]|nr:M48 family metallopeptidase [bacterium]
MTIDYTLKKSSRARVMRITIHRTGDVVVTTPRLIPRFLVDRFVHQKIDWIEKKVAEFKSKPPQKGMQWGTGTRKEFNAYKISAQVLATQEVKKFAAVYSVPFGKVSVKNQKTRWGSCSK